MGYEKTHIAYLETNGVCEKRISRESTQFGRKRGELRAY